MQYFESSHLIQILYPRSYGSSTSHIPAAKAMDKHTRVIDNHQYTEFTIMHAEKDG
jgi:hypothetical protein